MSLKRRNLIAWLLILVSAVLWTIGQYALSTDYFQFAPTSPSIQNTTISTVEATNIPGTRYPTTFPTTDPTAEWMPTTAFTLDMADATYDPNADGTMPFGYRETVSNSREWGFLLSAAAVAAGFAAIFLLRQTTPLLGPDGLALLLIPVFLIRHGYSSFLEFVVPSFLRALLVLALLRELWGWIGARLNLDWCISARIAKAVPRPQYALLIQAGWVCVCAVCAVFVVCRYYYIVSPAAWIPLVLSGCFGIACLWKFGADLHHFNCQLDNFQNGSTITVKDGTFARTEAQLLEVQAQHEEALRQAVTSERFKVELISNVSHDLRTPLTSILGYSELLQKETLSPEGQEQLRRLHQKAGYMNDLVESLFELTKVSSGVIEAKKEQIDLVRLLEQTIGLFDDQLTQAGLFVRRSYTADAIPVVTDGARMHQVFANLLGNAIKYALAGTRIYLEVKETENSFLIRMMNTASYEMDFQPEEIMQRFARGDKARSTKGSGLGLAIAQTYTESVGGTFRVSVDGDQFSAIVELPKN